ncbi:MAG: peptidylprolyl isomerase [Anaerolineae bacterium]|nr:peptidylprolyl isomerase [Anaerolineae bacterium]
MRVRNIPILLLLCLLPACGAAVTPLYSPTAPSLEGGEAATAPPIAYTPTLERPLAALVNHNPIYLVDYERQVAQYQAAMAAAGMDLSSPEGQRHLLQAREQILNWMIEQVLIEQAAAEQGIVVTDAEVDTALNQIVADVGGEAALYERLEQQGLTLQDVRDELQAELIGARVIEWVTASVPTTAEHVRARHILVDTIEEAEQILAQIQAGADFDEMAHAYSQDESTRAAGGDLGFFPRGVLLAPEIEQVAFALQAGQTSQVVPSSFGFHIVQVFERDPNRPLSPENLQLLREQAFQEWIETLWAQAEIERYVSQGL